MQNQAPATSKRRVRWLTGAALAVFAGVLSVSFPLLLNASQQGSGAVSAVGTAGQSRAGQGDSPAAPGAAGPQQMLASGRAAAPGSAAPGSGGAGSQTTFSQGELQPQAAGDDLEDVFSRSARGGLDTGAAFNDGRGMPPGHAGAPGGLGQGGAAGGGASGGGFGLGRGLDAAEDLVWQIQSSPSMAKVSEPGTLALLLVGLVAVATLRRRGGSDSDRDS